MAGITGPVMGRDQIQALLERGIRMVFFQQYDLRGNQFERVYNVDTSVKRQETDAVMAGLGLFPIKAEGKTYEYDAGQQAWTKQYIHTTYAMGILVTREGQEDDLYGYYTKMSSELGRAAAYTREVDAMATFNSLSATVYTAGGTNFPLLSTTHFRVDGGTWANRPTAAVDLSIESLETMLQDWYINMVDQRGLKINVPPRTLLVGRSDWMLAKRILQSNLRPQGNDNDINAVQDEDLDLFVSDFLTNDGRFFLLAEKGETALNWFNRRAVTMDRNDDWTTGNMAMVASYRSSVGASHVSGIYGSP